MMETLNPELTRNLLDKHSDWKLGITPTGKLATKSCFVQKVMPAIVRLVPDQSTAQVVTHSAWTLRLVDQGVLWDHANDSTIHSLSMAQLLFYPQQHAQHPLTYAKKTLHLLSFETAAWFAVNQVLRPTRSFQTAIEQALVSCSSDYRLTLERLMQVFDTFGYLWPQKIILGRRTHAKKSYKVYTPEERLMHLRMAKDDVWIKLTKQHEQQTMDNPPDQEESLTWSIIKRNDVCPIYEFLEEPWRQQIKHVIHECLYRIPIDTPIKLRHFTTDTYLSWSNKKQGSYGIAAIPLKQMASTGSHYLWRFNWTTHHHHPASFTWQPQFLRCGSTVYLSPACDISSTTNNNDDVTTSSILTRSLKGDSRLRSVELISPPLPSCEHSATTTMTWRVDLPGLGLGRDDDSSTDEGLNMDILIGRCRPILHRDIIALRQILYLCGVPDHKQDIIPILAKENGLLGDTLEHCWYIELASEEDVTYHQQNTTTSTLSPLSRLTTAINNNNNNNNRKQQQPHVNPNYLQSSFHSPPPPNGFLPSTPTPCTIPDTDDDDDDQDGFETLTKDPRAEPYLRLYADHKPTKTTTMAQVWKSSSLKQMITRATSL
ncbi:hypothetical protein BC941DRAFT_519122 [Chlamydoabsidia padenii]|nr:hypothetical protein BC941DRAFT_519122 [Chlamydoabsidia padenii]